VAGLRESQMYSFHDVVDGLIVDKWTEMFSAKGILITTFFVFLLLLSFSGQTFLAYFDGTKRVMQGVDEVVNDYELYGINY
jgi:hypothetical protein